MEKQTSISTRVDPEVKRQAEAVLAQLGISMSTAMEIYLRQIALQRKIPFEMALPNNKPIAFDTLTDTEFNALMDRAMKQYVDGECTTVGNFEAELSKDFGI